MRVGHDHARSGNGDQAAMQALAEVPALAGCDPDRLGRIAALATEVRRPRGAVLQRPGRLVRQALVVVEGVAAERSADGADRALPPGRLVGGQALHDPAARTEAAVVALTDVRVLVFGPPELGTVAQLLAERTVAPEEAPVRQRWSDPVPGWAAQPSLA